MKLVKLIKNIDFKATINFRDIDVKGLTLNSREVKANFIFAAIKGFKENGAKYIPDAISNGAKIII